MVNKQEVVNQLCLAQPGCDSGLLPPVYCRLKKCSIEFYFSGVVTKYIFQKLFFCLSKILFSFINNLGRKTLLNHVLISQLLDKTNLK